LERFVTLHGREDGQADFPPFRVRVEDTTDTYGKFVVEPLPRGFGQTLGNALRRVLLGALPGAAVTWVRIEKVFHEYQTLPGMREDVFHFLQNIKGIRIRPQSHRGGRMRLVAEGPGIVTAGDIQASADLEIVNPSLYLATLEEGGRLEVEFNVEVGRGYRSAQEGDQADLPIGTLPVDAIFSPIRKANFQVEPIAGGPGARMERLILEVWTDRTLTPQQAVERASAILHDFFFRLRQVGKVLEGAPSGEHLLAVSPDIYNMPIERLDLSSRTANALKRANITKVGEILEHTREQLLRIRNFGEKSLEEVLRALEGRGIPIPDTLRPPTPSRRAASADEGEEEELEEDLEPGEALYAEEGETEEDLEEEE